MTFLMHTVEMADVCHDMNCGILPLGYALLAVDSYYDLRWVLTPSIATEKDLRHYYTFILVPRWKPLPHPGYWFPVYVMYKLCVTCPTNYNYLLLALFLPICYRYVGILNCHATERLQNWWMVVLLRVYLAVVTTWALQAYGDCSWQHHMRSFWLGWLLDAPST